MKCKICGHVTRTIGAMREHYLKNHRDIYHKRRVEGMASRHMKRLGRIPPLNPSHNYCPHCGGKL